MATNQSQIDALYNQVLAATGQASQLLAQKGIADPAKSKTGSKTGSPITSEMLGGGTSLIAPPQVAPSTQSAGMFASLTAPPDTNTQTAQQFAQGIAPVDQTLKSNVEAGSQTLFDRLFNRKTKSGLEAERYSEEVDPAKKELDEIQAQIRSKQLDYRRQIEKIQDNAEGMTKAGVAGRVSEIERAGNRELADLSIIEQAKLQRYDTAKEIADRAINAELEQEKNQIEGMKFWYTENRALLDEQEERNFETFIGERERLLGEQALEKKTLTDTKLELLQSAASQGAGNSILKAIQNSQTPEEAITAAGQYGGDVLARQLKSVQLQQALSELNSPESKLTATQQTALSYANRVADANVVIDSVGGLFTGGSSYLGQLLPNAFKNENRQKFEQAQRNFINAVLRRESGAAIADSEFANAKKQYFPQPGDSVGVINLKKANRQRTLENLLREGGQQFDMTGFGDPLGLGVQSPLQNNPLGI